MKEAPEKALVVVETADASSFPDAVVRRALEEGIHFVVVVSNFKKLVWASAFGAQPEDIHHRKAR